MSNTNPSEGKISKAAVLSLVLGVSIIGSFVGLILGIVSFERICKSKGILKGKGLAIAGMVSGVIGVLVGVLVPFPTTGHDFSPRVKMISNIKNINLACRLYAMDWDDTRWPRMDWETGNYPDKLAGLLPDYIGDESMLKARAPRTGELVDYIYFSGKSDTSDLNSPLVAAPFVTDGKRVIGFCDGHVNAVKEKQFQKMLKYLKQKL